jgi:hypothetical protein
VLVLTDGRRQNAFQFAARIPRRVLAIQLSFASDPSGLDSSRAGGQR